MNETNNIFDIVIPVGPNDKDIINTQIKFTKKNIIGYRNIYLICCDPTTIIDGCITINENIFPFSLEDVSKIHGHLNRNGWYLQQLLKMYALMYNFGSEYHSPYFAHMLKLDKELIKIDQQKSGICHHMMFEKKYLCELINKIESNHNDKFYLVFLKMVTECNGSGASEYEIYFNYMLRNYNNNIEIRKLNWSNSHTLNTNTGFDYISCHWYIR